MVTIEQLVDEIRALRVARDQADARLLLRLVEIEREHMDVIAKTQASFAQFLKSHAIVDPARYDRFKIGLAKIGADEALSIGSEATIVAGQLREVPGAKEDYLEKAHAFVAENRGVFPSQEASKRMLLKTGTVHEETQAQKNQRELAQLRARVQQLESENKALRRKLAKYEKAAA